MKMAGLFPLNAYPFILRGMHTACVTTKHIYSAIRDTIPGPVVQSIVSLTSSLRGQLVKCFTTL